MTSPRATATLFDSGWLVPILIVDRTPKGSERGDGEHIVHPHPRLIALVGAQPAVLAKLGRKDHLRGIGFMARFFFVFPEDLAGRRPRGISMDEDESWSRVESLLTRLTEYLDANTVVDMEPEARVLFEEYEARTDDLQADGAAFEMARDFASKFPSQLARVVLVVHAGRSEALHARVDAPVTEETVRFAIRIMEHVESHALAALDEAKGRGDLDYVVRRIHELGTPEFTRRDVHRATQKRFPDAKSLDEPLRMLVDRAYLLPVDEEARPGRPGRAYLINPRAVGLIRAAADTGAPVRSPVTAGGGA